MRKIIYVCICFFVINCHSDGKKDGRSVNQSTEVVDSVSTISYPSKCDTFTCILDTLIERSKRYDPANISFEKNLDNVLKCLNVNCIIDDLSKAELLPFIESIDIIILKQHLFWLKTYHQGYNIYMMNEQENKYIITFYLEAINYKIEGDMFLHSGFRYTQYLNKEASTNNVMIEKLLRQISMERNQIKKTR